MMGQRWQRLKSAAQSMGSGMDWSKNARKNLIISIVFGSAGRIRTYDQPVNSGIARTYEASQTRGLLSNSLNSFSRLSESLLLHGVA